MIAMFQHLSLINSVITGFNLQLRAQYLCCFVTHLFSINGCILFIEYVNALEVLS